MAFEWIGLTVSFGSQVRNESIRCSPATGFPSGHGSLPGRFGRAGQEECTRSPLDVPFLFH